MHQHQSHLIESCTSFLTFHSLPAFHHKLKHPTYVRTYVPISRHQRDEFSSFFLPIHRLYKPCLSHLNMGSYHPTYRAISVCMHVLIAVEDKGASESYFCVSSSKSRIRHWMYWVRYIPFLYIYAQKLRSALLLWITADVWLIQLGPSLHFLVLKILEEDLSEVMKWDFLPTGCIVLFSGRRLTGGTGVWP